MMISIDGINKLQADNKRLNDIIDSYQPRIQRYKDVFQWILDQWEIDTKEVQDKVLKVLQEEVK